MSADRTPDVDPADQAEQVAAPADDAQNHIDVDAAGRQAEIANRIPHPEPGDAHSVTPSRSDPPSD
ncbi:hypothetical protein [Herbiconiux liukaitaii]|uniref:hypothetical protein n=1 Tax=Herbiconiux liukaitaii TaxID=3342799 RepID=UPI0035B701BD